MQVIKLYNILIIQFNLKLTIENYFVEIQKILPK